MRLFQLTISVVAIPAALAYSPPSRIIQRTAFSPPSHTARRGLRPLAASKSLSEVQREIQAATAERERITDEAATMEIDLAEKGKALEELVARDVSSGPITVDEECILPEDVKEPSETEKLMKRVKDSGTAGIISYALWELAFWTVSVPVCVFAYRELTGNWPDFSNKEDVEKLGAEAFAFVNFARFAVPLRIGLALGTAPWIQENVVDMYMKKDEPRVCEPQE